MTRTGCAGCPYGKNFEQELAVLEKHEPKLYAAATSIFKDSYEYTRKYRAFQKQMNGLGLKFAGIRKEKIMNCEKKEALIRKGC